MKARECRNRSRPFFDWAAQQGLAAKLCQFVCQILRRRFDFMDNTYFVGEMLRVGLKTAHHSIDTASMKDKAVRTLICLVAPGEMRFRRYSGAPRPASYPTVG